MTNWDLQYPFERDLGFVVGQSVLVLPGLKVRIKEAMIERLNEQTYAPDKTWVARFRLADVISDAELRFGPDYVHARDIFLLVDPPSYGGIERYRLESAFMRWHTTERDYWVFVFDGPPEDIDDKGPIV